MCIPACVCDLPVSRLCELSRGYCLLHTDGVRLFCVGCKFPFSRNFKGINHASRNRFPWNPRMIAESSCHPKAATRNSIFPRTSSLQEGLYLWIVWICGPWLLPLGGAVSPPHSLLPTSHVSGSQYLYGEGCSKHVLVKGWQTESVCVSAFADLPLFCFGICATSGQCWTCYQLSDCVVNVNEFTVSLWLPVYSPAFGYLLIH